MQANKGVRRYYDDHIQRKHAEKENGMRTKSKKTLAANHQENTFGTANDEQQRGGEDQRARGGGRTCECLDVLEQRLEDVGIVVGHLALQDRCNALEAHSRVNVLRGEELEGAVSLAIVLDEHDVPDLQHLHTERGGRVGDTRAETSKVGSEKHHATVEQRV